MKHLGTKIIKTERLILRPFSVDDYKDMYKNWASDDKVAHYLTWHAHESEQVTKDLLKEWVAQYDNNSFYNWCVEFEGEAIGNVAVVRFDEETKTAKTAYCIGVDFWGKGIVTEAYKAVLKFLFLEVGIEKISTCHDLRNIGSGRVMEKCGLKEVRVEPDTVKGENVTISIKEITKDEFLSQNS